jgi:pimeloyl-ACP methyl ester carboxylesterase
MSALYRSAAGEARVRARYRAMLDAWPVPRDERVVQTREGETFVVVSGPVGAPPLVLLHGSGSNSAMWSAETAAWAPYFRIYAIDLIGDPGFSAPSRPRLDSGAYVPWLADVLDGLSVGTVALVGTSLGGWLALDFAIQNPHRVTRLVLLAPGGVGRQRPSFLFRVLPLLLLGAWGRRRALAITSGAAGADPSGARSGYLDFLALVQQEFRRRMGPLPIFPDAALVRLGMPVLALLGARDVILDSAETRRRLLAGAARAEVEWIADGSHALMGFEARILRFLRS